MIRKQEKMDLSRVAEIWLSVNIAAHDFIDAAYWRENFEAVKKMLPQAELYVYEDEKGIQGFVGLNDGYIEGIFVCSEMQSLGIGEKLLAYTKKIYPRLRLRVYEKNVRAIRFYQREGFELENRDVDVSTGEKEYSMVWKQ